MLRPCVLAGGLLADTCLPRGHSAYHQDGGGGIRTRVQLDPDQVWLCPSVDTISPPDISHRPSALRTARHPRGLLREAVREGAPSAPDDPERSWHRAGKRDCKIAYSRGRSTAAGQQCESRRV